LSFVLLQPTIKSQVTRSASSTTSCSSAS